MNESFTYPPNINVIISNVKEIWFWNSYLPTFLHDVMKYPVFFWTASLSKNTHTWHNNILSREGDGIFRKGKCDQTKAILDWIPVLIWSTFLFQKSSLPHSDYYNANQQIHLQFDSSLCANEYRISQKCLFSGSSYIMKSDIIMTCK